MAGVYIHIPFCKSKCPYCDFYSYPCSEDQKEAYVNALIDEITTFKRVKEFIKEPFKADSIYLGGGTPSCLSGEALFKIIDTTKKRFGVDENAEITVECNPGSDIENILPFLVKAGVNRISLGMQSAVNTERKVLGRIADKNRIKNVIALLKKHGITNISLDIMLGIPYQTADSLKETLEFAIRCEVTHISAYILKLEKNTHFYRAKDKYIFPDDDTCCDFYLQCCKFLKEQGFEHYEISNFAKKGFESRHNTKYWILEDYLGLGPGAHSFVGGKRFYFESNTLNFIKEVPAVFDSLGGDVEEYIMLFLRLKDGLSLTDISDIYGKKAAEKIRKKASLFKEKGLVNFNGKEISLTEQGMLLSNSIIAEFI